MNRPSSRHDFGKKRPFYTSNEIEDLCSTELRNTGLFPTLPEPIRIDRFIEKRFDVSPEYEDIGTDILGFSRFGPAGVEGIVISKVFDDSGTRVSERRLRTTLAHEAGHCLLHSQLFDDGPAPNDLFGEEPEIGPKILCREIAGVSESSGRRYDGNWWEYQANMAMGALLLPRELVFSAMEPFLETQGMLGLPNLAQSRRAEAERQLATVFEVNPVVARIRLAGLYPENDNSQLSL